MTSNGETVLNPSTTSAGVLDHAARRSNPPHSPPRHASSPRLRKTASPASSRHRRTASSRLQNGDNSSDDAPNESEAETVVLGDAKDDGAKEKKVIKRERAAAAADDDDDDDDASKLRTITEESRARSPATNGRSRKNSTADAKDVNMNGAKHGSERDAKSPVPTSPSSRTTSRHTKETSPTDSAKSPAHSTTSPVQPTTRGRSSSTVESRKRKLRDESGAKSLEPLRQKAKTEGLKDLRQPTSPATPGLGRAHKRSQSTQSVLHGVAGRKRREVTTLAIPADRKHWSDSSSENSSSPRPLQTPSLATHARVKRSSHRALTSPARAMVHKKNVDKFGATRLAREAEKGELSSVKAAYNAAPEELDQVDFAGIAPLQKAALHGWADVVEFLINKGCRTDCESNDRDTPLIDATENGHLDVVKLLLNRGKVNPHHQNKKGQRAIDVLDPDDDDYEELEKTIKEAMQRSSNTADDDEDTQAPLHQKTASRLLYNEYNQETLVEKSADGDIAAVGELINSNIKPNIACGVAASRGGHYDILSILLASGLKADPDPSKHSETPMLVAIGRGHLKIVNLLLNQENFDPTRRNRDGKTYFEISENRKGPKWEQERDILKNAYNTFRLTHKSPRRNKKEAPIPAGLRGKRKSSPLRRERSSSPRAESKRAHLSKSTTVPQGPPKSRRLMSGKEKANRDVVKRRRRVVSEESSEDGSEDEVRPPTKKKPRSFSEGEDHKLVKKSIKARSEGHDVVKRVARARSDDSEEEHTRKPHPKIRQKVERIPKSQPTPDAESPDDRKPVKSKIKTRIMEGSMKKRRASDVSIDDMKVKKTPTPSAKSTPAPPEKASTPDSVRERRQEAERQAAEAKQKAAEAEAKKREEEEAARKAAEEEEARKKAEQEAEERRKAEEAELERQRLEEEARKRAEEEARLEALRQQELAARQERIGRLPRALRRACELGNNRPLHFSGEELGISAVFLPLFYATSQDIHTADQEKEKGKSYIMSFQVAGILGLPELDLARLEPPFCEWTRTEVTHKQRELLLRQYDVALLAQDFRFPMEGTAEFDYEKIQESIREARQQFLNLEGLYWIEDTVLLPEVEKVESLRPLLDEIKDPFKRRQIHLAEECDEEKEKKHKPRKSFMDVVLGQSSVNGIKAEETNGAG
ncbi:hypothetical protein BDV96DRAFT_576711 [Lophiotrema nucula]|uniref:Uncharacterized protein n=1 Tax=Lophiotrema nucula TaxID=690887 RepID=A0A6A5Z5L4_9PLEO|nr:hypothetical protein BDV96DRAFT_576711 [Lophiotrema nucula]